MNHDNYELPSLLTRKPMESYVDSDDDEQHIGTSQEERNRGMGTLPTRNAYQDIHLEDNRLAWLMLGASFSILLMTTVPVLTDIPNITPWFSGDALWRIIDPLITLPFNLFIITRADIITSGGRSHYWGALSERSVTWLIWSLGAAIYVQGHGIHLAAAMFKHPIQDFNTAHPDLVAQYPILEEMYSNMRDLWEHIIAHYMYAAGAMIMSWVQLFAFRNQLHGPLPRSTKIIWCIGTVVYGALLAGVAIEFPAGLIVGLVYTVVIGSICVAMMLFNRKGLPRGGIFTMGRRMVIQFYLGACIIGLIIVIIWLCIFGFQNRKAAGIA